MANTTRERFASFDEASHATFNALCLLVPWYQLFTERIKYTLLEFWLFSLVAGLSVARMLAAMLKSGNDDTEGIIMGVYFAAHLHAAFFSAVGEALHFRTGLTARLSWYRMAWFAITQAVPFIMTQCIIFMQHQ